MSHENFFDLGQHATMELSMRRTQYAIQQLAQALFTHGDHGFDWIPQIADETGISEVHLRGIFFGSEIMSLQDYIILSDYAEIDPINDAVANVFGLSKIIE